MQNKTILSILLLTSIGFVTLEARKKVHLNDPLLNLVDGVPGAMDAVTFKQCFDTWSVINNIQYKNQYDLEGKKITFKDLVVEEVAHKKNLAAFATQAGKETAVKTPADIAKKTTALQITLQKIKEDFKEKTAHLMLAGENPSAKATNQKLVKLWIKNNKRNDSLLNSWDTSNEHELLENADCKGFFVFLNDLKGFLEDMMYSCEKARKSFKEQCLKKDDYDSFDKFFTN